MQIFLYFAPWNSKNTGWLVDIYIFKNLLFFFDVLTSVSKHCVKDSRMSSTKADLSTHTFKCSEVYNTDVSAYPAPVLGTIPLWSVIIKKIKLYR